MPRRFVVLVAVLALAATACGGSSRGGGEIFAVRASSDLGVGTERLLVAVRGTDGARLGGPELAAEFVVYPADEPAASQQLRAEWVWAIPDVSGLYRASVEFDRPGDWRVEVTFDTDRLDPIPLSVLARSLSPPIGAPAPPSDSPTADDVDDLSQITTDRAPNVAFYALSIAEAVTSGKPSVVVFATPRFCQTAICGPTLDGMKELAPDYPDVNWVHVEVFTNLDDPENLLVVPAVDEWGLVSEPWVFVVDRSGTVQGRFEGVVAEEEITDLLDGLL